MAREFNPDPWNKTAAYVDRTYPSGVARERPKLTPRIHCEPDEPARSTDVISGSEERVSLFNRLLRGGHSQEEQD